MAASSMQRPSAPLKTYSRRVNSNSDPQPTKKRPIEEISIVEESSLPKKFKRDSIQNYFKPLPTPEPSSDSLEPTPSSSPPSQTSQNPTTQFRSLQRPRRRLNARPNLAPINKMSDSGDNLVFDFDDDERDTTPYLTKSSASSSSASLSLVDSTNHGQHQPVTMTATGLASHHSILGATVHSQSHTNAAGPSGSQSIMASQATGGSAISGNMRKVRFHDDSGSAINTASSPKDIPKKLIKKGGAGQIQAIIDLGQTFTNQCKECGMPYTLNNKTDVEAHEKFHRQFVGGAATKKTDGKIGIWQEFHDPTIGPHSNTFINARHSAQKHQIQVYDRSATSAIRDKAEDFYIASFEHFPGLQLTSKELWSEIADPHNPSDPNLVPRYKLFIYSIGIEPVALLLAERASSAVPYRDGHAVAPSSPTRVRMSIDRIWVRRERQRGGIATKLVDLARDHFINGLALSKLDIAFSWPTSSGAEFGKRYVGGVVSGGWFLVKE